jgi:hypothetical protein
LFLWLVRVILDKKKLNYFAQITLFGPAAAAQTCPFKISAIFEFAVNIPFFKSVAAPVPILGSLTHATLPFAVFGF